MLGPGLAQPADALDGLPRGARCTIVVSSALARYALVPFSAEVIGSRANEALAGHVFRRTHGERVAGWRIAVAPGPAGHARVACALDAALLEALEAGARERGVTLSAVQPALVAAFNLVRGRLPASCWLAIEEPAHLVVALLVERQWRHLAAERRHADTPLARSLAREATLAEDGVAANLPCWRIRLEDAARATAAPLPAQAAA